MSGIPHIPSIPWQLMSSSPERRRQYAMTCALSAMSDGEKIICRIAFWLGFGWRWRAERLADRLDKITDEIEDFSREVETADASIDARLFNGLDDPI